MSSTSLTDKIAPLFAALPQSEAMGILLPRHPQPASEIVEGLEGLPPLVAAALWLYVDDLDRSHALSQSIETEAGAFWHGIMHRREGDFWNSKYWFRRAGTLPDRLGLDPSRLTDEVSGVPAGENPERLVELQRHEWLTLFEHGTKEML